MRCSEPGRRALAAIHPSRGPVVQTDSTPTYRWEVDEIRATRRQGLALRHAGNH